MPDEFSGEPRQLCEAITKAARRIRRAAGDVLAVLVRVVNPSGAVTEQDLRTAAAAGIELLLDPDEIRAEVTFVFLDVLARNLSPVMRAVRRAGLAD